MTTEKDIMLIKNIYNNNIGEEEKMLIEKAKKELEKAKPDFEKNEDIPKNLKNWFLSYIQDFVDGNLENIKENFMNIQFDENDVNFLKGIYKESKLFPFLDKIDSDDYYELLLDMKNETLKKRFAEKYRDVEFF